jgi:DNA-binding CsgD family transcriptional regulator
VVPYCAMAARIGAARFVGRVEELARLTDVLRSAAEGEPSTVLVGGDAGVGKTRLIGEFSVRAREQGALVLTGGCLQLGGQGLPFAPVVEALRGAVQTVGGVELRRLAGEDGGELARLVPALRRAEGRQTSEAPGPAVELTPLSQLRLFEALLGLLSRVASHRPLVLVVEDVHWADASTRDLLMFLGHNLRQVGVVLVVTFRTDELHRQHPLRPVLQGMVREEMVTRLDLPPFARDELALLLAAILGGPPDRQLLDALFDRSEGNAFFAEQLLVAGGGVAQLPELLRDVLLVPLDGLSAPTVEVLQLVAAAGGEVGHDLLAVVAGLAEPELNDTLRVVVERGVLLADSAAQTYRLRHPLLTEAVATTVLPGEAVRLHRRLAQAIEAEPRLAVRSAAVELAHHWHAAHDQPRSLAASLAAAREAEAVLGVVEARRFVERALELWPQVADAVEQTGLGHRQVLQWAAELAYLANDPRRAVALQEVAIAESDTDGDRGSRAVLLQRLGLFRSIGGDENGALAACAEAVRLVQDLPLSAARAQVLARYSHILMLAVRHDEATAYGHQALEIAGTVGDRAVEGQVLGTLGTCMASLGDEGGLALLHRARAITEQLDRPEEVLRTYGNEAAALAGFGRFDDAIDVASRGIARARQLGIRAFWQNLSAHIAWDALYLGRWDLVDEALQAVSRDVGGLLAGHTQLLRVRLAAERGELQAARAALEAATRLGLRDNSQMRFDYLIAQLRVALLGGDTDELTACVNSRPALDHSGQPDTILGLGIELRADVLRVLADRAAKGRGDVQLADTVLNECQQLAAVLPPTFRLVPVWLSLAEAEHARGSSAPDVVERWITATARCDELSLAPYGAYARYRLAQALLASGSRERARQPLREAHAVGQRLRAAPLERDILELARRARIDLDDRPAATPAQQLGLSPRETEVLSLVADGRTNTQIAEQLYISRKTASVHVSNILRKLQAANRGEAAAIAHRAGLTNQPTS